MSQRRLVLAVIEAFIERALPFSLDSLPVRGATAARYDSKDILLPQLRNSQTDFARALSRPEEAINGGNGRNCSDYAFL
jgi:hypothetical protein